MPTVPYAARVVDAELDELLAGLPAVALEGAKGVGKTRTALQRAATVVQLDDPAQRDLAVVDPARALRGQRPVLVDEWQQVPTTWDAVRRAVDAGAPPGAYLLAGSAVPRDTGTHSGAGRIVRVRMRPMTLPERGVAAPTVSLAALLSGRRPEVAGTTTVGLEEYADEICRSGLPAIRGLSPRLRRAQLDGYLDAIVDRDFPDLGRAVRNPAPLRRWMTAYAAATSTVTAYDRLLEAATPGDLDKPAKTTTTAYRDILERLWFLDPVPAWTPSRNHLARLAAAPKHHLLDPAFAARLLGVDADALAAAAPARGAGREATLLGQLFESLVTLGVRVHAQAAEARVGHLRLRGGDHEVDLVVERGDSRVLAVEVKLAGVVTDADVKHLHWLQRELGDGLLDAVVVTAGRDAYRRRDGIAVVPAALLGP
ncbi:ATP-binding protein [Kineococcus sp. SYSU DK001]|uniref:ATP-binding protein n=1 Tax=Kineococcus sp. SYSU DK001 TaxID=3383122 RepID=UPI003D7EDC6F